ncbi:topoisomerase IV [Methanobrevibacter sp.]|uniref:topoisomerase IV n=1 Tax=Methanobrevibacter sp. TaxID=66852 RepID=UPI003D7E1D3A
MKDSKEKEHRISNLKDLIDNVKEEDNSIDPQEDNELINYLHEDEINFDELEIDDEFIYHPDNNEINAINLEETPIDENFIINTPKEEKEEELESLIDDFEEDDIISDVTENFDQFVNAKIGKTPILSIISSILGIIFIAISILIFESRSDRIIDNVASGETNFISVIVLGLGILLLIYGIYKILGIKNPLTGITDSINSIDAKEKVKTDVSKEKESEKIIPKSNIPLDKDSYKIGEFNIDDIKNKFKKSTISKKSQPDTEDINNIPPAKEKDKTKKGLTIEEIEDIEYKQVKLNNETIDDIFAEVEDIDDIPIISIDSEEKEEKK